MKSTTQAAIEALTKILNNTDDEYAARVSSEALAALQAAPAQKNADLHAAIMNLPCAVKECTNYTTSQAYQMGHRDARHAAAELVAADEHDAPAPGSIDTAEFHELMFAFKSEYPGTERLHAVIRHIDAHLASAAPVAALTRWSYSPTLGVMVQNSPNGKVFFYRCDDVLAALQAAPAPGSIDTPAFQALLPDDLSRFRRDEIVAHIDAHIAQRAASGDAPVYQIANDCKPSGWSDVTKEEFDLHLVTTWRKKRVLYAVPAPIADGVAGVPVMEKYPDGWSGVTVECNSWLAEQPNGTRLYTRQPAPKASALEGDSCDREPFEVWAKRQYGDGPELNRYDSGTYKYAHVQHDWEVWQARSAAAPARHAEPVAEIANVYGDPDAFAEREIVALTDVQKLPIGTKLFAAPAAAAGLPLYTCIGKGGEYAVIGHALGAGDLKGTSATVYRDLATGQIYVRNVADFHKRMEKK